VEDVGGQIGAPAKRRPRIKLWHWIVIVGFAALATDIGLRWRSVPETSKFGQPSAAKLQTLEKELQKAHEEWIRSQEEWNRDISNDNELLRRFENTQDGSRDLRREPRSPDGNGRIIQI
jgi:hypothetical protein